MGKLQTTRIFQEIETAKQRGFRIISEQGSSRSSKTYNTLIWLLSYLLRNPKTTISICRSTLPSLKRSVLRDFVEILNKANVDFNYNKTNLEFTFANGSFVEFFACDNEQKLRGSKRKVLYVNEANELKFIEFQQLQLRTTEFSLVDYNPSFSDEHWLCQLNKDVRTYHFITTYKDNPFLEQNVIDEIESLKEKNPSLWRIYGLGLQSLVEGLIFDKFDIIEEVPDYAKKRFIGMDFGYTSDPTAIVFVAFYEDIIFIDEICYNTKMLAKDIINEIKDFQILRGQKFKVISESADPRLIDEIYHSGINIYPVKKYQGSILAGIQKLQSLKICITKNSTNVLKEFRNYTWQKDKEDKWINQPIDAMNHAIDAIRYVVLEEVLGKAKGQIKKGYFF